MSLHVALTNEISEVQRLKTLFVEYGEVHQFSRELIQDIHLVLEEAVSNIIFYGYEERAEESRIDINVDLKEGTLIIEIRDDAKPFNPLEASEPDLEIPFDEREIGGMGIHLIRTLMDELEYTRSKGKNIFTMKKIL